MKATAPKANRLSDGQFEAQEHFDALREKYYAEQTCSIDSKEDIRAGSPNHQEADYDSYTKQLDDEEPEHESDEDYNDEDVYDDKDDETYVEGSDFDLDDSDNDDYDDDDYEEDAFGGF